MQSKDLKVGEIYAYRHRGHGRRARIMLLDVTTRYLRGQMPYGKTPEGTPRYVTASESSQTGPFAENVYLLAVTTTAGDHHVTGDKEVGTVADLRKTTLAQVLAEAYGRPSGLPQGISAMLVKPRWIEGVYADVVEAAEREAEIKASVEVMSKQRAEEAAAGQHRRVDALEALGLPGEILRSKAGRNSSYSRSTEPWSATHADRITLSLEQVDALLSLIPEGAKVPEPPAEVEDDGWTYAEGPTPEVVGSVHVPDEEPEEDAESEPEKTKRVRKPNGTYFTTTYCGPSVWQALGGEPDRNHHLQATYVAVTSSAMALARLICQAKGYPDVEREAKSLYGSWQRFSGTPTPQEIREDLEPEVLYIRRAGGPWSEQQSRSVVRYDSLNLTKEI